MTSCFLVVIVIKEGLADRILVQLEIKDKANIGQMKRFLQPNKSFITDQLIN